ncbi:glycosyltransferase family 2 protein [Methyloprofundus sedimenti]|uniref:glycosyltransferase family 2 protein n=1 Tax=Methyloprofundus sedimenti TaxID=1420851 RepID=UPI0009B5D7BA
MLIIIVTWNKKDYVLDLLNSLSSITFPRDQLDILVIDNASNDGTVEALKAQFDDIQIIRNTENLGGTGGFNTGLTWAYDQAESRYDYLWLLDNDVVVHQNALSELVAVLDANPDIAVAGSTMMQLDYPWRINEMGAFVDLQNGNLLFNRHYEEIPSWRGKQIDDLLVDNADLSQVLMHCQPQMDVEYVAAASLLIRAPVAKQTGLWMDFFIHFDDVEWCLRTAKTGHRIAVSAKSLIWHLSAAAKVPNWILYYDNRNVLYLLDKYSDKLAVKNTIRRTLKKYLYYQLIGKTDLAELHVQAITDFEQGTMGKKNIQLPYKFEKIATISRILNDPAIKKIVVPWTINMQASNIEHIFVSAMKNRPELEVFYIVPPHNPQRQLTNTIPILMPRSVLSRYLKYFRLRNKFDIALQSDYQTILPLSWIARENLFTNDEYFCLRPAPQLSRIIRQLPSFVKKWYQAGK